MRRISLFAYQKKIIVAMLLGALLWGTACSNPGEKVGAACDNKTSCDGVCLADLPGGMCTKSCADTMTCSSGECTKIAGGYWCLPTCQDDQDCRQAEGYLCIGGVCRTPLGPGEVCNRPEDCSSQFSCVQGYCGAPCANDSGCPAGTFCAEENGTKGCIPNDCSSGVCTKPCSRHSDCGEGTYCGGDGHCVVDECDDQGVCNHPCETQTDCPTGTYCTVVEGENHCVFVPEDGGTGTLGHSCAINDCAAGYVCISSGNEDPNSYCTTTCDSDFDCGPRMVCREAMDAQGQLVHYCLRRDFCEPCASDVQCGYNNEKCVAADPAVGGDSYCATACNPSQSDTCPTDATCKEAFWCAATGKWVADCSWCSGECGQLGAQTYQCFKDYGACTGDGSLCAPCYHSGQCAADGACLTSSQTGVSYCSAPCDEHNRCPDEFFCADVTGLGPQCVPRTGSCSAPSGGRGSCMPCQSLMDCISGSCVDVGGIQDCLPECTPGNQDECGPYMECKPVTDIHHLDWNLCVPIAGVDTCTRWVRCDSHCPEGPATCDGSAPDYCR